MKHGPKSDCPHNENNTEYCSLCLRAKIERLAAELRGAYNQGFSDGFDSQDKTIMGICAAADIGFNRFLELDDRAIKALEGEKHEKS